MTTEVHALRRLVEELELQHTRDEASIVELVVLRDHLRQEHGRGAYDELDGGLRPVEFAVGLLNKFQAQISALEATLRTRMPEVRVHPDSMSVIVRNTLAAHEKENAELKAKLAEYEPRVRVYDPADDSTWPMGSAWVWSATTREWGHCDYTSFIAKESPRLWTDYVVNPPLPSDEKLAELELVKEASK